MKAKRRHELQHNVLDAELAKTIEFFKKHGWTIVWVVLAGVAIWMGISAWRSSRAAKRGQIETQYAGIHARIGAPGQKPEVLLGELDELIDQTTVPRISALACVDAGDVCALQAHSAAQALMAARASGAGDMALGACQKEYDKHRRRAGNYYDRARDALPDEHLAVAKAHIGLAVLAETQAGLLAGDERKKAFAAALKEYRAVSEIGSVAGHPVAALAQRASRRLCDARGLLKEDYIRPVRMATTAPAAPSTQPAARPETQPATRPATRPARPEKTE